MYLIGDIGNTEIKLCLFDKDSKLIKKTVLKSNLITKKFLLKKLFFLRSKSHLIKTSIFSSVVPKIYKIIKSFLTNTIKVKSIELKEDQPRVHLSLGHVYKTIGLQKKSIESYRKTIKLDPQNGEAYWSLANLKTYKFTSKEIKEMLQQLENNDLSDREKVHFQFALGKSYEDQKKFQISFNYYLAGNSLNRGRNTYDPKAIEAMVDREIRFFNKSFFKERIDWGESTIDPIFIVGLPRSGSTLIEQILASHSLVEGTMELPNILNIARKLGNTSREGSNYPEILKKTTKAEAQQLGKKYIHSFSTSRAI